MLSVVSLISSGTEIVCSLGFQEQLVGRSHECDFPEEVKRLPVCTRPKFKVEGSSLQIDQRVNRIVQEALSVYHVQTDKLQELQPDLIITQSQCDVCAVSLSEVQQAVCDLIDLRPHIVSLEPHIVDDIWDDIHRVALALHCPEQGNKLVARLQQRMSLIEFAARSQYERPTVACIEWIEPLMAAGNWMPQLVDMAGGINLFGKPGIHSPWMTWEQLKDSNPDVIIVLPCGYNLEKTRLEMPALTRQPGWNDLRAVCEGRVVLADGNRYFNRPGPHVVESLEILAEVLHPRVLDYGHEASGWQAL